MTSQIDGVESEIAKFFKNSTIFVTGATGFLGKLCVEKLLRTCPDVKKIYILIRSKKGKDIQKRCEELFDDVCFEPLSKINPDFIKKIRLINGDISLLDLGINEDDRNLLIKEVNCVFHFAATVRFDEKIKLATYINVRGLRESLTLAKQMDNLKAFVHISTAYSNCINKNIEEKFYTPPIPGNNLIELVDLLDETKLEAITPILLGDFPNTYVFTKSVAEDVLKKEGKDLPVAIVRPSIVTPTNEEPLLGWINNIYGVTGVTLGVALGLIRVLYGNTENVLDIVPADCVVNSAIATAWNTGTNKDLISEEVQRDEESDKKINIPVYNYVSSSQNPLKWSEYERLSEKYMKQIPSEKVVWHKVLVVVSNPFLYRIMLFLLHTIPAYIVDGIIKCLGKKPLMVKGYEKIHKFLDVVGYFSSREWNFTNDNVQTLWNRLNKEDKSLFPFNIKDLNWHSYMHNVSRGGRVYLLKDPLDTVPKGNIKYYKVMFAHYALCVGLAFILFEFFVIIFKWFF